MMSDFTKHIIARDRKPVILIGMSIGGMLAYQIASKVPEIKGIIVTTLADPRDEETMIAMSRNKLLGKYGLSLAKYFHVITDSIRLPIKWLCKLHLISRNITFSKIFMEDRHAGGVSISLRFLRTFSTYKPAVDFADFNSCPLLLLHPEKDDWTPFHLSKKVYNKLNGKKECHLLKECGHAPIEPPGIYEIEKHMLDFIERIRSKRNG